MADAVKRTILVTGGSRGIGRGICIAFAHADNHIYFNYSSDSEAAVQTEKLVADAGGYATGQRVNVASEKEVSEFVRRALDETGRVDVLVNNAGITRDGLIVRMKEADWDDVLDINLKGGLSLHQSGFQNNDQATLRAYHQRILCGGGQRQSGTGKLRRFKGRHYRTYKSRCQRTGKPEYYGECSGTGIY